MYWIFYVNTKGARTVPNVIFADVISIINRFHQLCFLPLLVSKHEPWGEAVALGKFPLNDDEGFSDVSTNCDSVI